MNPIGIRVTFNQFYYCHQKPIIIAENGLGNQDMLECERTIHAPYQMTYLKEHFHGIREA